MSFSNLFTIGLIFSISSNLKSCFSLSEKCGLVPDSGDFECINSIRNNKTDNYRFYYSSVNYKCSRFPYSGSCAAAPNDRGNENNFLTEDQCKIECQNDTPEDWRKIKEAQNNNQCWYRDATFAIGEEIPQITKDSPCSSGCFCSEGDVESPPRIACAVFDCPPPPNGKNCHPTTSKGSCCPVYKCIEKPEDSFQCKYEGKTFFEGQKFYPDEFPCFACTCNRNFTGKLTTRHDICTEVNCSILVYAQDKLSQGCRPIYYKKNNGKDSCCPIDWDCK